VTANMFTIREVNANDKDNYILSTNIFDVAKEKGWWKEGTPFDFTKMYSGGEYAHKYYSGRRMWGFFRRAAPSVSLPDEYEDIRYKPVYPWSLKPDGLVSHRDFMTWHRDWYADTKYDMTKGLKAGPFGSPDRYATMTKLPGNWERSITLYRTNAVYVQHLQRPANGGPAGLASVAWYGAGAAHYTPFVPIPAAVTRTLSPLKWAAPQKFDMKSMNWAVRKIGDVCQVHFDKMHPMVEAEQKRVEDAGDALLAEARKSFDGSPAAVEKLNDMIEKHTASVLTDWHELATNLIFSFDENTDIREKEYPNLGYSDEWLKGVGYAEGPPDAPVEDQCPPKCGDGFVVV